MGQLGGAAPRPMSGGPVGPQGMVLPAQPLPQQQRPVIGPLGGSGVPLQAGMPAPTYPMAPRPIAPGPQPMMNVNQGMLASGPPRPPLMATAGQGMPMQGGNPQVAQLMQALQGQRRF